MVIAHGGLWRGGIALAVLGAAIAVISYPISVVYFNEYPGGFSPDLEEYVARRVSRLSRDEFIPRYKPHSHADTLRIRSMNRQVALALRSETLRLEQSVRTGSMRLCGVLVVGPRHSNKTGALWDAMTQQLSDWTFVRWAHHMDHPDKLALRLGQRIVLWLDDLHDFANPGEAAALDQFIQQLSKDGKQFLVLSSCRDRDDMQEARRYFGPLISQLQRVPATDSLPLTTQVSELQKSFKDLPASQRSVLETVDWLESLRIHTFPWEVLQVLSSQFLSADEDQESDQATREGLANHRARFVQVNQRADPQSEPPKYRYDFGDWFRYSFVRRRYSRRRGSNTSRPVHFVLKPINVNLLDLEATREERTKKVTHSFEQNPSYIINRLEGSPFAAETLILLGDAYLNHLGEHTDNAPELAIRCYDGALQMLSVDDTPNQYPGAWAAAHVGKGTAELRARKLADAAADFEPVAHRAAPEDASTQHDRASDANRPIPRLLTAYAWHGRGDAIAAAIPSDAAVTVAVAGAADQLQKAADYYQRAGGVLPPGDPLQAETMLDRANVLYVIARNAANAFAESLFGLPDDPPIIGVATAEEAYDEVRKRYTQADAPAVWAEVQRRLGKLYMMRLKWLLPAHLQLPRRPSDAGAAKLTSFANEQRALRIAKSAREYFTVACDVFAPSYLPASWLDAQVTLVRAQLIIARLIAPKEPGDARELFLGCFDIIDEAVRQAAMPGQSPLDWVDLQLLRAQSEFGIGTLGEGDAKAHYKEASDILANVKIFLGLYRRLQEDAKSKRTASQLADVESLSADIKRAAPDL
jgi:hypothetical protein